MYAPYRKEWSREVRDKEALKPNSKKIKCLVCGKWYVQVCSHTKQIHGITGREYRELYDLEVKRGIVPAWYREKKGQIAINNGTVDNLKVGRKFWFVKGDSKAGHYHRSHITLARLKVLHKLKK
jgi:predicted transcriptional regulator